MKKITLQKCLAISFGTYTFITILMSTMFFLSDGFSINYALTLDALFEFLLFSMVYGFSFYIFNSEKMTDSTKRIIHFCLNLVVFVLCFVVLRGTYTKLSFILASVFMFAAFYLIAALLGSLIRKLNYLYFEKK